MVNIETSIPHLKLFHFESFWIQHPGFLDTVKVGWSKPVKAQNMATVLCKKLKTLRHDLKNWSKGISKLLIAITNTNKAIFELDEMENKRTLTLPEANFQKILKAIS